MNFFSTYFDNIPLGSAWFILFIVLTGIALVSSGIFYGRLWQKRLWLKLRTNHCLIREQYQLLKAANTHQSAWMFLSGILAGVFAYFMKDWILTTFTFII